MIDFWFSYKYIRMVLFLFVVMMAVSEVGCAHCSKLKTDIIIILHYRHL